jgi:hypothetical protein
MVVIKKRFSERRELTDGLSDLDLFIAAVLVRPGLCDPAAYRY